MSGDKTFFSGKLKAGIISSVLVGVICGLVVMANVDLNPVSEVRGWQMIDDWKWLGEGDPGAGASGILEVFFINHSATNAYTNFNTSTTLEGWCTAAGLGYAEADDFNLEISYNVVFDIVVKVRVNKTHCWNGTAFIDAYVRMNITSTDLGISADSAMEKAVLYNNTGQDYIWLMFYYDFSDSGTSISRDETADITSIKLEAYY